MIEKIAGMVAGRRTRWITVAVWIILAALLSVFLPAVGEKEQSNAPNLKADSPSIIADHLIKEKFPGSSGIPALFVWHREGGLSDSDYSLIQQTAQHIIENPLKAQGEVIPLHQMPLPAVKAFASEDGSTLVQPISFGEQTETEVLKENIEQRADKIYR